MPYWVKTHLTPNFRVFDSVIAGRQQLKILQIGHRLRFLPIFILYSFILRAIDFNIFEQVIAHHD